tara:strand:- start:1622 stop:2701 length:1080 start_codon:yes stop_codon:yes gene_type:complete
MKNSIYIIAEAGINHNGNLKKAYNLVSIAKKSGADAVKFQIFDTNEMVTSKAKKAKYQINNLNKSLTHKQMLKRYELTSDEYFKIVECCKKKKITFLASAFDIKSLNFLVKKLKVKTLKIASGEITNAPLLLAHAQTNCNIILSTGMSKIEDIKIALGVLSFGFKKENINKHKLSKAFFYKEFKKIDIKRFRKKVSILHCNSAYPSPLTDLNLNAIIKLRDYFNLRVGFSDHSEGIIASLAASAMGASIIEKHFTISKKLSGPDHRSSLEPSELKKMVEDIRNIEKMMGVKKKLITPSEKENIKIARKSIVASQNILPGEKFSYSNIAIKRPGTGKNPINYWSVIGKKSKIKIDKDDFI